MSSRVVHLLELTKVDKFFPRFDSVEEGSGRESTVQRFELGSNAHISESRYGAPGEPTGVGSPL